MSSEVTETKPCANCKRGIALANFAVHEAQCQRHLVVCKICQVPVLRSGEIQHFNDVHAKAACAQCQEEVEKDQMAEHLKEACPRRQLQCEYCQMQVLHCDLATHVQSCGTRTESCQRCNSFIMLRDLLKHKTSHCAFPEARSSQVSASHTLPEATTSDDMELTAGEEIEDVSVKPEPNEVLNLPRCSSDDGPYSQSANQENASGDVPIPCEFCREIFPESVLVQHQIVCDRDTDMLPVEGHNAACSQTTPAGTQPIPEVGSAVLPLDLSRDTELLPCELCEELLPADSLLQHQIQTHSEVQFTMMANALLPCEFCDALLPANSLVGHQETCEAAAAIPDLAPTPTAWFFPENWEPHFKNENVKKVSLASTDPEYISVANELKQTICRLNLTIIEITRIQNHTLYLQYIAKKTQLQKQNPGLENEQILWHGTGAESVENINNYGFNRSYCGKNGTACGDGVYFAVDSRYSLGGLYSPPDSAGKRYLYRCHVLVGHSCLGRWGMKVLPMREPPFLYDSATNDPRRPSMYVIFNDTQAYPSYLITCGSRIEPPPLESAIPSHPSSSGETLDNIIPR